MPVRADTTSWRATAASMKTLERPVNLALRKQVRAEGKPLGERIIQAIGNAMPHAGGLSDRVLSGGRATVSVTGTGVRLSLANRAGMFMGQFESGNIRHRVFGRGPWVSQSVPAGMGAAEFDQGASALADRISALIAETIAREIK